MFAFLPNAVRPGLLVAWLVANFATAPHLAVAQSDPPLS